MFKKLLILMVIGVGIKLPLSAAKKEFPPLCISLGATCRPAHFLRCMGWRNEAYPFDWITSPFDALYRAIDEDFHYFLTDLSLSPTKIGILDHYGFFFTHDWPTTNDKNVHNELVGGGDLLPQWEKSAVAVKQKYFRRIKRFEAACLGKQRVLFMRTEYVTKNEAIALKNLIQSKWPNLDFTLIVIAKNPEFEFDWGLERIRNFCYDVNNEDVNYIKNILLKVAEEPRDSSIVLKN